MASPPFMVASSARQSVVPEEIMMLQPVRGKNSLVFVESIARMLSWAFSNNNVNSIDWLAIAEAEIERAKTELSKNGSSILSEEDLSLTLFYRALDRKVKLA